jgi:hypothetical protein
MRIAIYCADSEENSRFSGQHIPNSRWATLSVFWSMQSGSRSPTASDALKRSLCLGVQKSPKLRQFKRFLMAPTSVRQLRIWRGLTSREKARGENGYHFV